MTFFRKRGDASSRTHALSGAFNSLMTPLQQAVSDAGYSTPTPIQEQTISQLLDGRDVIGCAQTGTGKTAAFSLPMLQLLSQNAGNTRSGKPRGLILAPTRELAAQIGDSIEGIDCCLTCC